MNKELLTFDSLSEYRDWKNRREHFKLSGIFFLSLLFLLPHLIEPAPSLSGSLFGVSSVALFGIGTMRGLRMIRANRALSGLLRGLAETKGEEDCSGSHSERIGSIVYQTERRKVLLKLEPGLTETELDMISRYWIDTERNTLLFPSRTIEIISRNAKALGLAFRNIGKTTKGVEQSIRELKLILDEMDKKDEEEVYNDGCNIETGVDSVTGKLTSAFVCKNVEENYLRTEAAREQFEIAERELDKLLDESAEQELMKPDMSDEDISSCCSNCGQEKPLPGERVAVWHEEDEKLCPKCFQSLERNPEAFKGLYEVSDELFKKYARDEEEE